MGRENKRSILRYLIPVKMLLGQMPKQSLLEKYELTQFSGVMEAVKEGHLANLNSALKLMEVEDVDDDEAACIIANLIYDGRIKGYISHQHQKLVVSKQNAFPPLVSA